MSVTQFFLFIIIPIVAVWGINALLKSKNTDSEGDQVWREFARRKGLEQAESPGPEAVRRITGKVFKEDWSKNPAAVSPAKGTLVLRDRNGPYAMEIDFVAVKGILTVTYTLYSRFSLEIPDIPRDLRIHPRSSLTWLANLLVEKEVKTGDEEFDRFYVVRARDPEQALVFLTDNRRRVFLDWKNKANLQVRNKRLWIIFRGVFDSKGEFEFAYSNVVILGQCLVSG